MVKGLISQKIVVAKLAVIDDMFRGIDTLPLSSESEFSRDSRMVAAGESFLRRALEALLDLGRHVLAKGFGIPVAEYAAIADQLTAQQIVPQDLGSKLKLMAGYRNRLVHGYEEVSPTELYGILTRQVVDITAISETIRRWCANNPESLDERL